MTRFVRCTLLVLLLETVTGQLRPRRVGVGSLGEVGEAGGAAAAQEAGGGGGGGESLADLMAKMGGGDLMNNPEIMEAMKDPAAMQAAMAKGLEALGGDPDMMKNIAAMGEALGSNPEVAEMLSNPSKMQEKMAEVAELMNTDEGKQMQSKIMEEVESVLTDPEKMRQGLEQFASNPLLKGMADAMPELKQVLEDPETMQKSIAQAQDAIAQMGGMQGMQEKMAEMMGGDGENPMAAMLKAMAGGMGGGGGEATGDEMLQERVRQQLATMLQGRGGEGEDDGAAVDIDEF